MTELRRVGMVGLGAVGGPIAHRMLGGGVPLTVFARREEVAAEFAARGAAIADSATDLAAHCDLVIVCVFSDRQLLEVTTEQIVPALRPGSVLASHTTGSPATIVELQQRAGARGAAVLDAPVSGDPAHIDEGQLTVMVGGDAADLARADDVFATYANQIIHVGPVGSAMAVKLVNNLLMAANLQLAQAAIDLGEAMGAGLESLARVMPHASGRSYAFEVAAEFASIDRLNELAAPYLAKDVGVVRSAAASMGVELGILEEVFERGPLNLGSHRSSMESTRIRRLSRLRRRGGSSS